MDHNANIKIYASGSSSLAISSNIQESLAGRKRTLHIYPLSFEEYLRFRNKEELIQKLAAIPKLNTENINKLVPELYGQLDSFLIYGGYPEVALTRPNQRREVFESIFDLYVKKDTIKFWRTKTQVEVDILLDQNERQIPLEIKHKEKISRKDIKGLKRYMSTYPNTRNAYLINLSNNTSLDGIKLLSPFDLNVLVPDTVC